MHTGSEREASKIEILSEDNFRQIVDRKAIVVVDCWAAWCKACKDFAPVFEATAEKYPEHTFATLNTGSEEKITRSLGIAHVPTLLMFRDGIILYKEAGYMDTQGLEDIISQAESLDMEVVRKEIASEKTA